MMGGAIKRSGANNGNDKVVVRYTEEVVIDNDEGKIKKPEDHITHKTFARSIQASEEHPIRMINLGGSNDPNSSAGSRTQLTSGEITEAGTVVQFYNKAMEVGSISGSGSEGTKTYVLPKKGDRIRIFWEEEVGSDTNDKDYAVEVTISPNTLKNPGEVYKNY